MEKRTDIFSKFAGEEVTTREKKPTCPDHYKLLTVILAPPASLLSETCYACEIVRASLRGL